MVGCWHGYLSGARCRLAYGPADATATQTGFTFLVLAHPGSPGQRAVKCVCVCDYYKSNKVAISPGIILLQKVQEKMNIFWSNETITKVKYVWHSQMCK